MIERLRAARKESGLTQIEVAKHLGKGQSYISKIENCIQRLDILELIEFVEIYDIKSSDIFGD